MYYEIRNIVIGKKQTRFQQFNYFTTKLYDQNFEYPAFKTIHCTLASNFLNDQRYKYISFEKKSYNILW